MKPARPVRPEAPAREEKRPILVVDDDAGHRLACRDLLEDAGYVVEEASNGEEALKRLIDPTKVAPALVVLDLSMPVMDGWELLAVMTSYTRLQSMPVVLISAHEPRQDPGVHRGISAFLRKPYDAEELRELAETLAPQQLPSSEVYL
jgi:CheY-like chemotaxis protein